ncbi:TPA: hypothetical protein ACGCBI_001956 [Serratia marcescens]|nr:hypothetical protein [Serratia marcescens]HEJ6977582.1 hypothetical protein [Serratia marcescens]
MKFDFVTGVLDKNNVAWEVEGEKLFIIIDNEKGELRFNEVISGAIESFEKARQYNFDYDKKILVSYRAVEILVQRLNQNLFEVPSFEFKSNKSKAVVLSRSTKEFSLGHFQSEDYTAFFKRLVRNRIVRRIKNIGHIDFEMMLWNPITIKYSLSRKIEADKMLADAIKCFESCLFKLAVDHGQAWDLYKKRRSLNTIYNSDDEIELNIPLGSYDNNLVNYYKVAVSSQFSSQSFLSYYHILEYNFLSVSEEELQSKLKANIQSTNFSGSSKDIESIINVVKKHNDKSDEKDMLNRVLKKYISQEELKDFIEDFEKVAGEKYYTKSKKVFGEDLSINIKNEHMFPNTAYTLKHIRNALVHSSDKYNREDCHIPLTESEDLVSYYVPLVRFLAEKIICAK